MSNLGLERALASIGVEVERCGVGDREVVARLRATGLKLGGEQSGLIVQLDLATTGDGLLTALTMARLVAASRRPLSALLAGFRRFPQVLVNVPVARKPSFDTLPEVKAAVRAAERALGREGRLVLRYSGTEALARVMIEGPEQGAIESMARDIARELERALAGEGLGAA
jgi:phosphoglucosamine mutase